MKSTEKLIVMIGCFDTKGEDFSFLLKCLMFWENQIITINTGVMDTSVDFRIDYANDQVAASSGTSLKEIRDLADRGKAVELMGKGASKILEELVANNGVKGVIGMGGGGGTYIALEAMQSVPLGIPKLCLSTLAAKDLSRQVGVKDITLMASVVDVAGLNSISKMLMQQAAAAICAMSKVELKTLKDQKKRIAISMFGNTTKCVNTCTELLKRKGYEVFAFHATGTGGATMESLIREGCFDGVLDVTTTELADELCEGILTAGPTRLTAAAEMGLPQVVVPGCLDMVNFAQVNTVPKKYQSRQLYSWSPDITLMRTNEEENRILGEQLVSKLKQARQGVEIVLPLKGISQLDSEGELFYNPKIDAALFESIKANSGEAIRVSEINANINDQAFAEALVDRLLGMLEMRKNQHKLAN